MQMVALVSTTRKIKPIHVCARSHGREKIVKWVSIDITVHESKNNTVDRSNKINL